MHTENSLSTSQRSSQNDSCYFSSASFVSCHYPLRLAAPAWDWFDQVERWLTTGTNGVYLCSLGHRRQDRSLFTLERSFCSDFRDSCHQEQA